MNLEKTVNCLWRREFECCRILTKNNFLKMLAFICHHTKPGHKNNPDKPEKKCEPINGIAIGYGQKPD